MTDAEFIAELEKLTVIALPMMGNVGHAKALKAWAEALKSYCEERWYSTSKIDEKAVAVLRERGDAITVTEPCGPPPKGQYNHA